MVKESGSSMKKKRKTATSADSSTEIDIYKKVVDFEEKEASVRSSDVDADILYKTCDQLRKDLFTIADLKHQKTVDACEKKAALFTEMCVKIVIIKKLNRIDKVQHVFGKEALTGEKQKGDSIKLAYQNLVYELNHLLSEINKCLAFKSKDEDIVLIPFEEFMTQAPVSMTKKFEKFDESNSTQKHALRLARLEYELQQRKTLAELCKSLQEEKKKLALDIVERKDKLDALLPLLQSVLNATKPLQKHLDLPLDQVRAEHKLAHLLSDPLYIFYANCVSYNTVYDSNMKVVIIGDADEATNWKDNQENIQDEEDSEPEVDIQEEVVEKKRRHRKSVQVDPMEEKKKKLLEIHPLSVEVTMSVKDGPSITITMRYFTKLKIITVVSKVDAPAKITADTAREILAGENILNELIEGDLGMESPNPSTPYQLKKVGFGAFCSLVRQVGHAYNWAQGVCGLNFLMKQSCSETIGRTNVEVVMKTLYRRLVARNELAHQLQQLQQNILPLIPTTVDVPSTAISALTKFTSITHTAYCQMNFTKPLVESDLIQPCDMFYAATLNRANAHLQALIVIKNSYPSPPPIFSLCLNYNGSHNSENSDEIRDIERALNVEWEQCSPSAASWLLSAQLTQLCSYLDVYLETEDPNNFPQNAMFLKNHCARNRRRPFKFHKVGTGIFTQY